MGSWFKLKLKEKQEVRGLRFALPADGFRPLGLEITFDNGQKIVLNDIPQHSDYQDVAIPGSGTVATAGVKVKVTRLAKALALIPTFAQGFTSSGRIRDVTNWEFGMFSDPAAKYKVANDAAAGLVFSGSGVGTRTLRTKVSYPYTRKLKLSYSTSRAKGAKSCADQFIMLSPDPNAEFNYAQPLDASSIRVVSNCDTRTVYAAGVHVKQKCDLGGTTRNAIVLGTAGASTAYPQDYTNEIRFQTKGCEDIVVPYNRKFGESYYWHVGADAATGSSASFSDLTVEGVPESVRGVGLAEFEVYTETPDAVKLPGTLSFKDYLRQLAPKEMKEWRPVGYQQSPNFNPFVPPATLEKPVKPVKPATKR